jgi:hypothetical protein
MLPSLEVTRTALQGTDNTGDVAMCYRLLYGEALYTDRFSSMMNSIDELYPLLRFLRVSRYNDWKLFSTEIGKVSKDSCSDNAVEASRILCD